MAVQLDGKATEKHRKYIGVLSSQGKEKFGPDFSIRKMAEQQEIDWENMTMEEANKLIKEVKEMIESPAEVGFQITEKDLIKRITERKKRGAEAGIYFYSSRAEARASFYSSSCLFNIHSSSIP
jgi:hypothetical protein